MQASLPIGCQGKGLKVTLVAAQRGDAFDFVKSAIGSAAPHQGSDSGLASLLSSTCASNCALFATCWLRSPPRSQTDISFRLFDLAKGAKVCPGAVPRLVPGVLRGPVRYAPTPSAVVVVDHARGRAHGLFAKRVCAAGLPAAGCHEYLLVQRLQQRHARSDLWHDGRQQHERHLGFYSSAVLGRHEARLWWLRRKRRHHHRRRRALLYRCECVFPCGAGERSLRQRCWR